MLNCRKHISWTAFIDGLVNNDEKEASTLKHTHIETRVKKNTPYL